MTSHERQSSRSPESSPGPEVAPLVVDLDGTLVRTDTLWESLILFLKHKWRRAWKIPIWLTGGKAHFKDRLAQEVELPVHSLPRNPAFIEFLESEKSRGRTLILATAANEKVAHAVAADLPLFDHVLASSRAVNLSGSRKLSAIKELLGDGVFDYAANDSVDLAVWRHSRRAILVEPSRAVASKAESIVEIDAVFEARRKGPSVYLQELRIYQWPKNLLVFLPLAAAHRLLDWSLLGRAALAFLAWSLCASAVYVLNDLLDLTSDREHPKKCQRPFAAGDLPLSRGAVLIPSLAASSAGIAYLVSPQLLAIVAFYLVVNIAYSGWIKRIMLLDVMTIASVYTLRVVGGSAAVGITPTFWLLAFSMFLFLDLALVKRYADLVTHQATARLALDGRDYQVKDLPLLLALGASAGSLAVLVLALYINSPEILVMYGRPELVWLLCPLVLYWTGRMWMKAVRGEMHHDPLIFALRDRTSWIVAMACLGVLSLAI